MRKGLLLLALLMLTGAAAGAETAYLPVSSSPTTGLLSDAPYRPLLVSVSNSPEARPHWGLAEADIVYETIYWGPQHTRYFALYNDTHPEKVGSVRGVRVYNAEWMLGWDAPMAHFGGQDTAETSIYDFFKENEVPQSMRNDGTRAGRYFTRDESRVNPHNAVFDAATYVQDSWPKDDEGADHRPQLPKIRFSNAPTQGQHEVDRIDVRYDDTSYFARYRYDSRLGQYRRDYCDTPQLDAETYRPMQFANVIVQAHELYFQGNNRARPVMSTTGAGKADFYIEGRLTRGLWVRPGLSDPVQYFDNDGNEMRFKPGKTFIQVVPGAMYDQGKDIDRDRVTYLNTLYFWGEELYSP